MIFTGYHRNGPYHTRIPQQVYRLPCFRNPLGAFAYCVVRIDGEYYFLACFAPYFLVFVCVNSWKNKRRIT
jgi:hypothetical protein